MEDTAVTLDQLALEFPKPVIDALELMTHNKQTDYFDYVRRLSKNPLAKKVKLLDLAHNSNDSRFLGSEPVLGKELLHRKKKYSKAIAILNGEEA